MDGNVVFAHQRLQHCLRHVRLERPDRALIIVHCPPGARYFPERLRGLPWPGGGLRVVLPQAFVEFSGEATDRRLVAAVRPAEATAREPAQVALRADDHDRFPHRPRLDGGNHGGRSAAVDDDVKVGGEERRESGGQQPRDVVQCFHGKSEILTRWTWIWPAFGGGGRRPRRAADVTGLERPAQGTS